VSLLQDPSSPVQLHFDLKNKPLSMVFTIAAAARMLLPQITMAHQASSLAEKALRSQEEEDWLRVTLLGARMTVEGGLDWSLLRQLIGVVLGRSVRLHIELVGPEIPVGAADRAAVDTPELQLRMTSGTYHETQRARLPHCAIALNGGIDSEFASWAPTLLRLRGERVPAAFTGYTPSDEAGCERVLRLIEADIVVPTHQNPFRCEGFGPYYSDGFLVGVCGGSEAVFSQEDLVRLHKQERVERIEELAVLNERDGCTAVGAKLRELKADLIDGSVVIPEDVGHQKIEKWAQGVWPKAWS